MTLVIVVVVVVGYGHGPCLRILVMLRAMGLDPGFCFVGLDVV